MQALAVRNAAALREQYVAEQKILVKSYNDYLGIEEAGKGLVLYAAGNNALTLLKKQHIGFGNLKVLSMINHPCQKAAIKIDSANAQVQGHQVQQPWGPNHKHHCILHAA